MSSSEVGGLQEAALERKLKLQALKNRYKPGPSEASCSPERDSGDESESSSKRVRESLPSEGAAGEKREERPSISFRNYKPSDQNLKDLTAPDGRPERFDEQVILDYSLANPNTKIQYYSKLTNSLKNGKEL